MFCDGVYDVCAAGIGKRASSAIRERGFNERPISFEEDYFTLN